MLVSVFVTTLDADVMSKNCNAPLQSHHAVEYGLWICKRSEGATPVVVTAVCRFCEVFGKEEAVVGIKRSCLGRIK